MIVFIPFRIPIRRFISPLGRMHLTPYSTRNYSILIAVFKKISYCLTSWVLMLTSKSTITSIALLLIVWKLSLLLYISFPNLKISCKYGLILQVKLLKVWHRQSKLIIAEVYVPSSTSLSTALNKFSTKWGESMLMKASYYRHRWLQHAKNEWSLILPLWSKSDSIKWGIKC